MPVARGSDFCLQLPSFGKLGRDEPSTLFAVASERGFLVTE